MMLMRRVFFFFNDTATTEIYTLSLHDALPISPAGGSARCAPPCGSRALLQAIPGWEDRKSTRLNSSHSQISYAVFCLKKKKVAYLAHVGVVDNHLEPALLLLISESVLS